MALQLENESEAMSREDKEYVREQFKYLRKLRKREGFAACLVGIAAFIILGADAEYSGYNCFC